MIDSIATIRFETKTYHGIKRVASGFDHTLGREEELKPFSRATLDKSSRIWNLTPDDANLKKLFQTVNWKAQADYGADRKRETQSVYRTIHVKYLEKEESKPNREVFANEVAQSVEWFDPKRYGLSSFKICLKTFKKTVLLFTLDKPCYGCFYRYNKVYN